MYKINYKLFSYGCLYRRSIDIAKKGYLVIIFYMGFLPSYSKDDMKNDQVNFYKELAYRYAPIHYQDTDNSKAKADYLTRFDYDNNWKGNDNWENLNSGDLSAYVYYSVVETSTHWFIVYAFFHPRDWTDQIGGYEHENDMEGILSIVKKDATQFGSMQGMITVAHEHFYSYVPAASSLSNGDEDIDGRLSFALYDGALHPKTCQEAKGHGIKAWPYAGDFSGNDNRDGIIYFPSKTNAAIPSSGNDRFVKYKLINITSFGNLWMLQIFESTQVYGKTKTYAKWGTLKGNVGNGCGEGITVTCSTDAANTPWGWDDTDDEAKPGELALDPAGLVKRYFNGLGDFNTQYISNKYLEDLKNQGFRDNFLPRDWPAGLILSDLYMKLQQ